MAEAPSPAAAYVPRLPIRRTPHFFENDAAPREWSVCSWERTIADSDAGSTPADSSRSAMSRAPRPASMRMRVSPDSMTVVLPELPDPRTLNRTVGDLTRPPCHGETVRGTLAREAGGEMLDLVVMSIALAAPIPGQGTTAPQGTATARRQPPMDREEVEEFLEEVTEYLEHRRKAREELPKLREQAEPEEVTA